MPSTAYVALGSNLGARRAYLEQALQALRAHPGILVPRTSSVYETAPVGGPAGQGPYLNAVAMLQTGLSPEELLPFLHQVEQTLGRVRAEKDAPRTLRLDPLLYDPAAHVVPAPILPHP